MRPDSPSRTALAVAIYRAAHQTADPPPIFVDPLARRIIGRKARDFLAAHPHRFERSRYSGYLRAVLASRSRVAEDALAGCVARGVRQYVVLGAGLDTFGLRNANPDLRVFEVDHPRTQEWKRGLIAQERLTVPATLTFVPVDFETQELEAQLMAGGLDPSRPAFFSWLGVTQYLERQAIEATLTTVARLAGPTGGIIFDFFRTLEKREWLIRLAVWVRGRRVARLGEPFRAPLDPEAVRADLLRLGFGTVDILSPAQQNAQFFQGRGRLKVGPITYLARALGRTPSS